MIASYARLHQCDVKTAAAAAAEVAEVLMYSALGTAELPASPSAFVPVVLSTIVPAGQSGICQGPGQGWHPDSGGV
jgi:hypothetical protein